MLKNKIVFEYEVLKKDNNDETNFAQTWRESVELRK